MIVTSSQLTTTPVIADDQYRERIAKSALTILNMLFASVPATYRFKPAVKVLVIGAGFFPSFKPFIESLSRIAPALAAVELTLIEPLKSETDRFETYYDSLNTKEMFGNINITCHSVNQDIKEYLRHHTHMKFDIVYFEQPDLSPIGIILAKNGDAVAKLELSLRESIPYLKYVINEPCIIIASFLFKRDLTQLMALLRYSLRIKTKVSYLPTLHRDGSPYHAGLISMMDPHVITNIEPDKLAVSIQKHDSYYSYVLATSCMLFLLTPVNGKLLSIFFTIVLLFYHRYGYSKLALKLIILMSQLCVLLLAHTSI